MLEVLRLPRSEVRNVMHERSLLENTLTISQKQQDFEDHQLTFVSSLLSLVEGTGQLSVMF